VITRSFEPAVAKLRSLTVMMHHKNNEIPAVFKNIAYGRAARFGSADANRYQIARTK
jgi:hypothetical protein